jgi:hypothetical protein
VYQGSPYPRSHSRAQKDGIPFRARPVHVEEVGDLDLTPKTVEDILPTYI